MWYLTILTLFCHHELALAYKAAVVEYSPITADTPQNTIRQNQKQYRIFTQKAKLQSADIIVFPEYGLTTLVDNPAPYSTEVNPNTPLVKNLSSLAKEQGIYLVVNLLEKVERPLRTKYYNTNLVFDRNGTLVLQYRKINLFGEPNLTAGAPNQVTTFETDFGVTFAILICFDILYRNPSRTSLKNDVTDVVYPTSWFSTMAFYSSLTVQHGYASATGVNLLASNLGDPRNTHGGSGIYLAGGGAEIHISDVAQSKLVVREVPKSTEKMVCPSTNVSGFPEDFSRSTMNGYATLRDFRASDYNFIKIDLGLKTNTTICYKKFCCAFETAVANQSKTSDIYKVMAYDGIVPFDVSTAHIRVCALLLCKNDSNDSCGTRVKSGTKFTKIAVQGNLEKNNKTFYTPLTLDYYYRPLVQTVFCDTNNGTNSSFVKLSTLKKYEDVVVFGLFGRTD